MRGIHALIARRAAFFVYAHGESSEDYPVKLLTNNETAEFLGLRPTTLEQWRLQGKGPVFRKIGRLVRYVESDVLVWLEARTCTNTSQYPTNSINGQSRQDASNG